MKKYFKGISRILAGVVLWLLGTFVWPEFNILPEVVDGFNVLQFVGGLFFGTGLALIYIAWRHE